MTTIPATILATSVEQIDATVAVDGITAAQLAAGYTVKMAFLAGSSAPTAGDWRPAAWVAGASPATATILYGAGGFTLAAGTWQTYVKVTGGSIDQALYAGPLIVSAGPWSYSGDPSSSTKDAVRFWLDDTSDPVLFTDAEITYVLASGTASPLDAAAQLAERLALSYAKLAQSETVGDVSRTWGDRSKALLELAKRLQIRAAVESGEQAPIGLGLASDEGYLTESYYWRGMLDSPLAPAPDTWPR